MKTLKRHPLVKEYEGLQSAARQAAGVVNADTKFWDAFARRLKELQDNSEAKIELVNRR